MACISGNEENCTIPENTDEKQTIYLSSLVEQGYIDLMKSPESDNFCEGDISYVEVKKTGTSDYEYTACLYCGEYHTENAVCTTYTLDGDDPVCGEITGASTRWTKERRTISVKCSDTTSGCGCATWGAYGAYGAWTNATSCTANSNNKSQTNTECRTIYN